MCCDMLDRLEENQVNREANRRIGRHVIRMGNPTTSESRTEATVNITSEIAANTTSANTTTTTATTTVTTTDSYLYVLSESDIIGIAVGATCTFILIVFIIILLLCRRRRTKKIPPVLPDPYARPSFAVSEPARSSSGHVVLEDPYSSSSGFRTNSSVEEDGRQSESIASKHDSNNYLNPVQYQWIVQDPVIHSPEVESDPYFFMSEPSVPISNSPPSPGFTSDLHFPDHMALPMPCRSPDDYINVRQDKPLPSPLTDGRSRRPIYAVEEDEEEENEGAQGNYRNVLEVFFSQKTLDCQDTLYEDEATQLSPASLLSFSLSDSSTSQKDISFYHNVITPVLDDGDSQEGVRESHMSGSSIDRDVPESNGLPTAYQNVVKFPKMSHAKQHLTIKVAKSAPTKLASPEQTSEDRSPTKPRPPAVLPKTKISQQASPIKPAATGNIHLSVTPSHQHKATRPKVGIHSKVHGNPQLISANESSDSKDKNAAGKIKSPHRDEGNHPSSRNVPVPEKKLGEKLRPGKHNKDIKCKNIETFDADSTTYTDAVSLHQNSKETSSSDHNSLSRSTGNLTHNKAVNTHSKMLNSPSTLTQKNLTESTDKTHTSAVQQPKLSVGASRSPLQKTKFVSSPNVGYSANVIDEMRSKLKKFN